MTSAATILASIDGARRASHDIHFQVEQFYYTEAELLDDGRFTDWLDLLADDLDYWMPTRTNRLRRQQALSISARGEAAFYDETKESLAWRIRRFDSGMAWAEDPPSRTRHLVTNVVVHHVDSDQGSGASSHPRVLHEHARAHGIVGDRCSARCNCARQELLC